MECKGEVMGKRELTLNAGSEQGTVTVARKKRSEGYKRNESGQEMRDRNSR